MAASPGAQEEAANGAEWVAGEGTGCMGGRRDGRQDRWTDGWIDTQMDGWTDGWVGVGR